MFKRFTSSVPQENNKELNLENRDQIIKKFRELLGKDNEKYDDNVNLLKNLLHLKIFF